ncbi:MAG: type II secretion system protein [Halothiobacillaceae bacterium]
MMQRRIRGAGGFTLVEMAVVLVIIGLILGAVMIGKDVQRNAEYSKIKQKFVDQWVVAYNTYYQRTGVPLGDDQTAPRLMVNGANFDGNGDSLSGRDMSGVDEPSAICQGAQGQDMDRGAEDTTVNGDFALRQLMLRAGVRMPPGRAEGSEDRYVYLDSNGNPQEVQVCFQWNEPDTASGAGNVMVLTGLTPDLARALDQMIDGKPDECEGMFRREGATCETANQPGQQWQASNTQAYGQEGIGEDAGLDENQVQVVVAHYKMNQ